MPTFLFAVHYAQRFSLGRSKIRIILRKGDGHLLGKGDRTVQFRLVQPCRNFSVAANMSQRLRPAPLIPPILPPGQPTMVEIDSL